MDVYPIYCGHWCSVFGLVGYRGWRIRWWTFQGAILHVTIYYERNYGNIFPDFCFSILHNMM